MDKIKESVRKILGESATFSLSYDPDLAEKYIKARKKELSKQIAGQTEEEKKLKMQNFLWLKCSPVQTSI